MSDQTRTDHAADLPLEICDYIGLLRDEEIKSAINRDLLLIKDSTDQRRVRQASYELRLSDNVEFLVLVEPPPDGEAVAKYERPVNGCGDTLRIDPGQTVKVYAKEIFNLPTNIVAHVFPVGNIYKLGLSPETTYADPGFEGSFYIILCNYSERVVDLRVGQPIARVEFIKLARSTTRPHPGQRGVTEPTLWPRRVDRRSRNALQEVGVDRLLDELDRKDPPHVEHAFVAREVKSQNTEQLGGISRDISHLKRQMAGLQLLAYGGILLGVTWIIGAVWHHLPDGIQKTVKDEVVKAVVAFLLLGIPLLFRRVRQKVALVFRPYLPRST